MVKFACKSLKLWDPTKGYGKAPDVASIKLLRRFDKTKVFSAKLAPLNDLGVSTFIELKVLLGREE